MTITEINKIRESIWAIMLCLDCCDNAITELKSQDVGDLKEEVDKIKQITDEFIVKMGNSLDKKYNESLGNKFDVFYNEILKKYVKKNCK